MPEENMCKCFYDPGVAKEFLVTEQNKSHNREDS